MEKSLGSYIIVVILLIAALILYLSATTEWWVLEAHDMGSSRWSWLRVYAYGLVHNMSELRQFITRHETPPSLMIAAKAFTMSLVTLTLLAAFLIARGRMQAWKIPLVIGLVYLLYSLAFIPVLEEGTRTAPRPLPVEGEVFISMYGYTVKFVTKFEKGYYLAILASILLISTSIASWGWSRRARRFSEKLS